MLGRERPPGGRGVRQRVGRIEGGGVERVAGSLRGESFTAQASESVNTRSSSRGEFSLPSCQASEASCRTFERARIFLLLRLRRRTL